MKRKIYRVRRFKDFWGVWLDGARRPVWWVWHKANAVAIARRLMRTLRHPSQLVVHGTNGRIQSEWTYGKDPRRTRG
jgi:hypothetical protein